MNQPSPPMALRLSGEGCLSAPARGLHGAAGLQRSSLMRIDHFGAVMGHSAALRSGATYANSRRAAADP